MYVLSFCWDKQNCPRDTGVRIKRLSLEGFSLYLGVNTSMELPANKKDLTCSTTVACYSVNVAGAPNENIVQNYLT